jgi:hypothetical protein
MANLTYIVTSAGGTAQSATEGSRPTEPETSKVTATNSVLSAAGADEKKGGG